MITKTKVKFVSVTYRKLNLWSEMCQFKTALAKFPLPTNNSIEGVVVKKILHFP